jgi:type IX secretion system PorP/SprF family membrane protein
MRKTILITLLFLGALGFINAQQEPMYTQYMFNSLSFNPAYAGSHEYMSIRLLYRNQWVDFEGAPESQTFTIHSPVNDRIQ